MRRLFVLTAAALLTLGIAGCGGDDGATGPQGPQGPAGAPGPAGPPGTAAVVLTPTTPAADFADLKLVATVTSVSVNSNTATTNPGTVVKFKLATDQGVPVIGFGSSGTCYTRNSTTTVYVPNCYPNLAFSLAKLVPGSGGAPSKWVNYLVRTVPTKSVSTGVITASVPSTPTTDNYGTLVDNKDGTYTYTFYYDVPGMKAAVDAMTVTAPNNKADLGDLTYDANLTHRLSIVFSGNAPGTGTNTANGVQVVAGVPLKKAVDVLFDFVPATGLAPAASANRKMVNNANCESCHSTLGGLPGDSPESSGLAFHGSSRNNIEYCVICHTDQRRYGRTEVPACPQATGTACYNTTTRSFEKNGASSAPSTYVVDGRSVGNAPNFLHKIHVADVMTKTNYNYQGVEFDKGGYSQDIRNCEKCHDPANASTPQASLWRTNPNRLACGSCHDGINFDTGVGLTLGDKYAGLSQSTGFFGKAHPENATDGTCTNSSCHGAGGGGDPELVHRPVTPPNKLNSLQVETTANPQGNSNTNAGWIASNQNRLPAGAIKIAYDVKSVSRLANGNPQIVFRLLQNGTPVNMLDFATAPINPGSREKEMWANFMGSPSAYFVWAVPQDGIAKPADFNASASVYLRSVWNGTPTTTTATLAGIDDTYYAVTLTNVVIPETAVMLTGGMGYSYNARTALPLTQTNLPDYPVTKSTVSGLTPGMPNAWGGLIVIARNANKIATGCPTTNDTCSVSNGVRTYGARRTIVDDNKCNACHQELGTFTEDAFHAGQRNDGTTCAWCHTANRTNQGWSVNAPYLMHAIHGAAKRSAPFKYDAITPTEGFFNIKYPGILARCEQCHIPGAYDYSNAASANAVGLGFNTSTVTDNEVDKRLAATVGVGTYLSTASNAFMFSPYVVKDAPTLGSGFSYTATTGVTVPASSTTLVLSPTVAICTGCHDTSLARSHMEANGGSFYRDRTTAFARVEQCFICHSTGKLADIKAVHAR